MAFTRTLHSHLARLNFFCAGLALVALMILCGVNVFSRMLGKPLSGLYELAGYCGALVVAFALAETQRQKGYAAVDFFSRRFPAILNRCIDVFNNIVFCVFFAIVSLQIINWGQRIREAGELSETLKIMYHPFIWAVAFGFICLTLTIGLEAIERLAGFRRKQTA